MSRELRKLYAFHVLLSIALTAVANFLFLDALFLRMGLNMAQLGLIKGLSLFLPMVVNLLISPWIMRLNIDRWVVAVGYLLRVALPLLFPLMPRFTRDPGELTAIYTVLLIVTFIFPTLGNNSMTVLIRAYTPREQLGRHSNGLFAMWVIPAALLLVPMSLYLQRASAGTDEQFLWALGVVFAGTAVFQLPATWLILRLPRVERVNGEPQAGLRQMMEPIFDRRFSRLLSVQLVIFAVVGAIGSFMYPYLIQGRGLGLFHISLITAASMLLGGMGTMFWGRVVDRVGGRNIVRLALLGMVVGVFLLALDNIFAVLLFALLAWNGDSGLFGSACTSGLRYMTLSMSKPERMHVYIAVSMLVTGLGLLLGSVGGGLLLVWLNGFVDPAHPDDRYRIYFTYCALAYLIVSPWVSMMRDGWRRVDPHVLTLQMFRSARSVLRRGR